MSLDVWVVAASESGKGGGALKRRVAALEWDGYYEYLRHFWPSSSSSGRVIDLYDSAYFEGANLVHLRGSLLRARAALENRPASWDERIGTQTYPVRKELYGTVDRARLNGLIGDLLAGVDEAEARRGRLCFEGD